MPNFSDKTIIIRKEKDNILIEKKNIIDLVEQQL